MHKLFLVSCLVLFSCINTMQVSAAPLRAITPESVEAFFDITFEAQKLEHELVGVSVAVVKDGEIVLKKGYGFADLEQRIPVDPDKHLFRIASISKTFTWTAVMQLVERGKLDLEADIQTYLDFDIPKTFAEPIKLKHLLTHTPGFEDQGTGSFAKESRDVIPLKEFLPAHIPARVRKPGTYISYSNYGSAVAGYIVERVSGIPWADYLQQNILDPLEMTETNLHQPMTSAHKSAHAKGYSFKNGNYKEEPYWYEFEAPAGVMSATANDISTWMLTHLSAGQFKGKSILKPATVQKMHSELFRQHPDAQPVLHGFYRTDRNGVLTFGHGGDVNQFHSNLSLMPEHNLGVFVSFNSDPSSQARSNILLAFIDYFFPEDFPEVLVVNKEMNLDEYLGDWLSTRRNHSTFEKLSMLVSGFRASASDGELVLSSAANTSRWIPVANDRFRAKYTNQHLLFYRDNAGLVTHFSGEGGLGSFERRQWYESSSLHQLLFGFVTLISFIYLCRFIIRLFSKTVLPNAIKRSHQWLAAISSGLMLFLVIRLVLALNGDTDAFLYGVPDSVQTTFALSLAMIPLAIMLVVFSSRQWSQSHGTWRNRVGYCFVVLASLLLVGGYWFWNILSFFF